jgi:hypothetical protein
VIYCSQVIETGIAKKKSKTIHHSRIDLPAVRAVKIWVYNEYSALDSGISQNVVLVDRQKQKLIYSFNCLYF